MKALAPWLAQAVLYAAFAVVIAIFSRWPVYQHLAPDHALIKLSFVHHGERLEACEELGPEELAKLPPNMRAPVRCPRARAPITVELDVDGAPAHRAVAQPGGLARDGAAAVYHRLEVPAGTHRLAVRLRDSARDSGFDHERSATVELAPTQILVIDFDAEKGGITLQ